MQDFQRQAVPLFWRAGEQDPTASDAVFLLARRAYSVQGCCDAPGQQVLDLDVAAACLVPFPAYRTQRRLDRLLPRSRHPVALDRRFDQFQDLRRVQAYGAPGQASRGVTGRPADR